jgi:hypothetical protein
MNIEEEVLRVQRLSDQDLLAGLTGVLASSRQLGALMVAHLGEVDARRLHLLAGHGSLFAYCTRALGMSEDEACRRIDVARLARRFPVLFERLAMGQVSLSVAALLKARLDETNHLEILAAVSGKTVVQAREVLAAWFPGPDVAASIRKLPERRIGVHADNADAQGRSASGCSGTPPFAPCGGDEGTQASAAATTVASMRNEQPGAPRRHQAADSVVGKLTLLRDTQPSVAENLRGTDTAAAAAAADPLPGAQPTPASSARTRPSRANIEPLSPGRYKIVFTADADLKQKLELARDLLRHAVPSGDLPTIIGRALELLLEKTLQRRFAKTARRKAASRPAASAPPARSAATNTEPSAATNTEPSAATNTDLGAATNTDLGAATNIERATTAPRSRSGRPSADPSDPPDPKVAAPSAAPPPPCSTAAAPPRQPTRRLPNETRRAVLERDGLRCTWTSRDGTRCESRAWLEHDHALPRALGGADDPSNIRLLCQAHNRLAAEHAYGQPAITRIIEHRRAPKRATPPPNQTTRRQPVEPP